VDKNGIPAAWKGCGDFSLNGHIDGKPVPPGQGIIMGHPTGNRIIFVSGGSRSGKSRYAEQRAAAIPGPRTYIATCPVIDAELEQRIARHRRQRADQDWRTIEEPVDLLRALRDSRNSAVVLVDCLTLWINNLLFAAQEHRQELGEEQIDELCQQLAAAARQGERTVIFVTNELGMGLVPADRSSRLYRDLVGRCNQTLAARADEVVLLVSGCPLQLKGAKDQ